MPLSFRHLTSSAQLTRADTDVLFERAREMESVLEQGGDDRLRKKIIALLFYQPSTRTKMSFSVAVQRLGGMVESENGIQFSSLYKGESLEDNARVASEYVDAIVQRHPDAGSAVRAASGSMVPFINAGDGENQHPTQSLLDVYTILKEKERMDELTIALAGDLRFGRTVHSLCQLMSLRRNIVFTLISPEVLRMPDEIKAHLDRAGVRYAESTSMESARGADVLYMTRVQQEKFKEIPDGEAIYERVKNSCILDPRLVRDTRTTVMHPLPRVNEIPVEVDALPNAAYFRQVRNGLPVRMALLDLMVNQGKKA